ncbi:hypothetical protein B0H17DRAFT_1222275 [Mycena rosella]|uniref:Uncharacterized protein n=1 Tax=Mycena rosella TaxID=1033263 RepID=A0AAD7AYF5_MYCRO|nr:hypothetical protein B0H17DRAFT_1222275 [Mycena rosella]
MPRLSSRQRRARDVLNMFIHYHTTRVKTALHRKNKMKCALTHAGVTPDAIAALVSAPPPVDIFDTLSIDMNSDSEGDISSVGSDMSSLSSGTNSESSDDWSDLFGSDWRGVSSSSSASSGSDDAGASSDDGMPELHPAGYPDSDDELEADVSSDSGWETSSSSSDSGGNADDEEELHLETPFEHVETMFAT